MTTTAMLRAYEYEYCGVALLTGTVRYEQGERYEFHGFTSGLAQPPHLAAPLMSRVVDRLGPRRLALDDPRLEPSS